MTHVSEPERRPHTPCDEEQQGEPLGGDPPCWLHLFEDEGPPDRPATDRTAPERDCGRAYMWRFFFVFLKCTFLVFSGPVCGAVPPGPELSFGAEMSLPAPVPPAPVPAPCASA